MKLSKHLNTPLLIGLMLLSLSGAYYVSQKSEKPTLFISKQESGFNVDDSFFKYFNLGQKRLMSSIIWIMTILESDNDHYKNEDLNSWMFHRFNTISNLEPLFYENYAFGGPYLSIIKDDLKGATYIYNKGLSKFPDDFYLLKNAAFHFHFEVEDYQRSREIHKHLLHHKNINPILYSSLARIESELGNKEAAFTILLSNYNDLKKRNQTALADKTKEHLYAIRAEIDLECLNGKTTSNIKCNTHDLNGAPYIKDSLGRFKASKAWTPFKIKKHQHSK